MNSLNEIADKILKENNFSILTHASPDGDTLGSGFALCLALQSLGKAAEVITVDEIPSDFEFLTEGVKPQQVENPVVVSVDIASTNLLEKLEKKYADSIDICIDHHRENTISAEYKYVDKNAAANAEIIYELICLLGVPISREIANCIYTGISTDTGCYKFSNTTPKTHEIAAEVMKKTPDWKLINKKMFDTKTREQMQFEQLVLHTLEFFEDGKVAVICVSDDMKKQTGVTQYQSDFVPNIPCKIEGVLIGITVKEKGNGECKASVRANGEANASELCKQFGGGGHKGAAGLKLKGSMDEVKKTLAQAASEYLRNLNSNS